MEIRYDNKINYCTSHPKTELLTNSYEIREYIANKAKLDFEEIFNKQLEGYRLSYIIDNGHNRGAR